MKLILLLELVTSDVMVVKIYIVILIGITRVVSILGSWPVFKIWVAEDLKRNAWLKGHFDRVDHVYLTFVTNSS